MDDRRRVTVPGYHVSSPSQYMARRLPAARSADADAGEEGVGVDCGAVQAADIAVVTGGEGSCNCAMGWTAAVWSEWGGVAGAGQGRRLMKTELLMTTQRRLGTLRGRSEMRDGCDWGGAAGAGQGRWLMKTELLMTM